ncbi:MAG: hypothetical protein ACU841_16460 [Gammaproteobacteria bacterium]
MAIFIVSVSPPGGGIKALRLFCPESQKDTGINNFPIGREALGVPSEDVGGKDAAVKLPRRSSLGMSLAGTSKTGRYFWPNPKWLHPKQSFLNRVSGCGNGPSKFDGIISIKRLDFINASTLFIDIQTRGVP